MSSTREVSASRAEWRIRSRRSFTDNRFYVDTVTDPHKGTLRLIADNLTESEAALIAAAPDLLSLAKRCAGECAGCDGKGTWSKVTNIAGPAILLPCEDCADIRKVIDKAEGRS